MNPRGRTDDVLSLSRAHRALLFLRRGLILAIVAGFFAATAALYAAQQATPLYQASSTALIVQSTGDEDRFGIAAVTPPPLDAPAYSAVAKSRELLESALGRIDPPRTGPATVRGLREALRDGLRVQVREDRHAAVATFTVRHPDPAFAATLATAWAEALADWDRDRAASDLNRVVATLQRQLRSLDAQIDMLEDTEQSFSPDQLQSRIDLRREQQQQLYYARTLTDSVAGRVRPVEDASVPTEAAWPDPLRIAGYGAVLGAVLAYLLYALIRLADPRLRNSGDVARTARLPVLAEFPKLPEGVRTLPREAITYLRTNLSFATADADPKIFMVTSPGEGDGKSSVAASLAVAFARDGHRTLLIDADLRKPVSARVFGLRKGAVPSLADRLAKPDPEASVSKLTLDEHATLHLIPGFDPARNPTELLGFGFQDLLNSVKPNYDVIVIDTAPVLPVADSLTIAPHCTGTVLVASARGSTTRPRLRATVDLLERLGVRILGVVTTQLPKRAFGAVDASATYGYGYGYGHVKGAKEPKSGAR